VTIKIHVRRYALFKVRKCAIKKVNEAIKGDPKISIDANSLAKKNQQFTKSTLTINELKFDCHMWLG